MTVDRVASNGLLGSESGSGEGERCVFFNFWSDLHALRGVDFDLGVFFGRIDVLFLGNLTFLHLVSSHLRSSGGLFLYRRPRETSRSFLASYRTGRVSFDLGTNT